MPTLEEQLQQARLPEKTVPVFLRGDLAAELEELDRQYEEAPAADERLNSGGERRRITAQAAAVREQMQDSKVVLRLRALPQRKWDALIKAHPPVDGNTEHAATGYNTDTFFEALVTVSVVEPTFAEGQWEALRDVLTARQWRQVVTTAQALNLREVDVPFSQAASQQTTASEPE